jgi:predicted P-loop ATPase
MEDFVGKYKNQYNYLASNYQFRFNICSSQYEYRKLLKGKVKKESNWHKYDDRVKNKIMLEMFEMDLDISQEKFNLYVESETVSKDYDPFLEYFEHLKRWDGKTDYIKQLSDTIGVVNTTKSKFQECLTKFLIGTVDCLLEEDSVNDVCLVFQSGQGIGKTRWMRKLLPEKFRSEYLYEGNIDTRNKDHVMYLSQYWFIHLDELEALKGNEISATKSFITRQRISVRKAFGRYKSHFIRRASFIGSVNDDKFLTDITGNRRWLVFTVNKIEYEHKVDVDGVWSQVYALWQKGVRYWFDSSEIKDINNMNEEFRAMSTEEEQLLQLFDFPEQSDKNGEWFSATDAIVEVSKVKPILANKLVSNRMGKALSRHIKAKKIHNGVQKYYLKLKPVENEQTLIEQTPNGVYKDEDDLPF